MDIFAVLSWTTWAGAVLGLIVYGYAYILRPQGDRLLSTAGLFFTAIGLTQVPLFLRHGAEGENFMNGAFAVVALLAAVAAQALAAVRGRIPRGDKRTRATDDEAGDAA